MATLYIVATPIGNLGDITLRAIEILKTVQLVAAEDTRRTLKLLTHLGIQVKLLSCRAQNEGTAGTKIAAMLDTGQHVAYVTDAGTPGLSDPGQELVTKVLEGGHKVLPVPGVSAFSALLSVAGRRDKTVIFEGFLSPKDGRRRVRLKELLDTGAAFVIYESPFRILKLFSNLAELDSMRYVCVGREMTKLHEQYVRGTAREVLELFSGQDIRGEFAVFVSGYKND